MNSIALTTLVLSSCFITSLSLTLLEEGQQRIINGTIAIPSEFPFIAAIIHKGQYQCAGSLISRTFILTAAHCVVQGTQSLKARDFIISVGSIVWEDGYGYRVKRIKYPSEFELKYLAHDIALLETVHTVMLGDSVKIVYVDSLHIDDDYENHVAEVMGWGFTNRGNQMVARSSSVLLTVALVSVPFEHCRRYNPHITRFHMCMTGDMTGTCMGDSGAPLVQTIGRLYRQIGILSYGKDCNNTTPEVYTRVAPYVPWISETVDLPHPLWGSRG